MRPKAGNGELIRLAAALIAILGWGNGCSESSSALDGSYDGDGGRVADLLHAADSTCAYFSAETTQVPAAMLIVLDRSASMSTNNKWDAARGAIVQAIDSPVFDNMHLGLLAYPASRVPAPACLGFIPEVTCGVSPVPDVPLQETKTAKTTASSGARSVIKSWLASHTPDNSIVDASPGYDAMARGIEALQGHTLQGQRLMLFITDGGFSCTSVSNPTRPGYSDGLCPDWEYPDTVIQLLAAAHDDGAKPVHSLIIGVPGSDSTGEQQGIYATAPYAMRLALSAYAYAGSPETVDPGCDGRTFAQAGTDPANPCHFDMTVGPFDADALAAAIGQTRGRVLGCTYELPVLDDDNQVIDKNRVNVQLTLDGGTPRQLPRRSDPLDTCTASACWDFNADGNVQLLGKACDDITAAKDAVIEIIVGCMTVLK